MNSNEFSSSPASKASAILVVEDNEMYRSVMCAALGQYITGCEVLEAASVKEALAILRERPVDVMVADMTLPDGSAVTLLDAAVSYTQAGLRVYVTSSLSAEDMKPLIARKDVAGYVEKTLGLKHLASIIASP